MISTQKIQMNEKLLHFSSQLKHIKTHQGQGGRREYRR